MAFKYLYCLEGADNYPHIFEQCHMPLDSFTLIWYKRNELWKNGACTDANIKSDVVWSSMDQKTYLAVAESIGIALKRGVSVYIDDDEASLPAYPLAAECIIWEDIQLHLATEEFIFSLVNMRKNEKEELRKERCLNKKLRKAKALLSQRLK